MKYSFKRYLNFYRFFTYLIFLNIFKKNLLPIICSFFCLTSFYDLECCHSNFWCCRMGRDGYICTFILVPFCYYEGRSERSTHCKIKHKPDESFQPNFIFYICVPDTSFQHSCHTSSNIFCIF